jgi:prepilin-type N-terminal cleavage/methylation domain-containing protein
VRRGYTLLEVLVAAALGLSALAVAFALFVSTRRMSGAGDLGKAMADASIAMEYIHRDLIQAVQKPGEDQLVFVAPETAAAQFLVAELRADGSLTARPVLYRREPAGPSAFRLVRRDAGRESALPGTYSHVGFKTLVVGEDPSVIRGRTFVRVTLHARARPESGAAATGSDEAVLTSLVRVAGPEMLNMPTMRWRFLDALRSVELVKGQAGF